jgi:hypothetical protein
VIAGQSVQSLLQREQILERIPPGKGHTSC